MASERGRLLEVAEDTGRVLAVEDPLRGEGADRGPQRARHLGAEAAELLLVGCVLEPAERPVRPQPDRLVVGLEETHRDRVAELVPGHGDLLALGVGDGLDQAGLDVAHRLPQVLPGEEPAPFLEGVHEGQRSCLLDHGRRVALGHARELVAALRRVQLRIVPLGVEVEGGDVLAVLAGGHPEDDLTAEPAGPGHRLVEDRGPVGGADEEQVESGRAQVWQPERDPGAVERQLAG